MLTSLGRVKCSTKHSESYFRYERKNQFYEARSKDSPAPGRRPAPIWVRLQCANRKEPQSQHDDERASHFEFYNNIALQICGIWNPAVRRHPYDPRLQWWVL